MWEWAVPESTRRAPAGCRLQAASLQGSPGQASWNEKRRMPNSRFACLVGIRRAKVAKPHDARIVAPPPRSRLQAHHVPPATEGVGRRVSGSTLNAILDSSLGEQL